MRVIVFLFVFVMLESMVAARVAQLAGWGTTLLLLLSTSLLGSYLVQRQGLSTWVRLNQRMLAGETPGAELVEGLLLLTGGFLLIIPGFITDALGLFLLLPPFRRALAGLLVRRGRRHSRVAGSLAPGFIPAVTGVPPVPMQGLSRATPGCRKTAMVIW